MKKKNIIATMLFMVVALSGCSNGPVDEDVVYGEIDTSKQYTSEDYQAPSPVERREMIDINDYFIKVPMNETAEKASSWLYDTKQQKRNIDRYQFNGVYFDVNEVASNTDYRLGVRNGVVEIIISKEGNPIVASVAQISDKNTNLMSYDQTLQLDEIAIKYKEEYEKVENQSSNEYGYIYTYKDYVDFIDANENLKQDLSVYAPEQVLQLAIDIFELDKTVEDFTINSNAAEQEYSDFYMVEHNFYCREEIDGVERLTDISVKRTSSGDFLFMTQYDMNANADYKGEIAFTPTMIINIAQNNYYQKAETFAQYIKRENYENGFIE